MKCPNCKFELPDDSDFCSYCGIVFATVEPRREAPPPAPEPPAEDPRKQKQSHSGHKQEYAAAAEAQAAAAASASASAPAEQNYQADVYDPYGLADPYGHGHTASQSHAQSREQYCELCGGRIDRGRKKCVACGKHYPLPKRVVPIVLLALALAASLLANYTQYNRYKHSSSDLSHNITEKEDAIAAKDDTIAAKDDTIARNEETIAAQAGKIADHEDTIAKQKTEIESLNTQLKTNEEKAGMFDKVHDALTTGTSGHGSVNFHASESVIFLSKSEKSRNFTLTADLGDNVGTGVYYVPEDDPSARVSFDTARFSKTAKLTVVPYHVGLTTVTFFNDKNSEKFNVIIIVTE